MNLFTKIAEFLKTYWIVVTVSVTILSIVVTGAIKYERKQIADARIESDINFVKDSTMIYLRSFKTDLIKIKEGQEAMNNGISEIVVSVNNSNDKFKEHLAADKTISKEQYLQLTNGINNLVIELRNEKKNSGTSMFPILYKPGNISMQ